MHRSILDLQRTAGNRAVTRGLEAHADGVAGQAIRSPMGIQEFFASRFGLDFSGFRIQTGSIAAGFARALNAKAFTVGRDIFFADGRYTPGEREGQRLLAHELAHVVQQRDLQAAFIQREDKDKVVPVGEFGPTYEHKKARSSSYEDYKANIGKNWLEPPIQAASAFKSEDGTDRKGTKISPVKIKLEELIEIMNPPGQGHKKDVDALLAKYVDEVNLAFTLGQLDTAESQALYLAHSAGETGSFSKMDEKTIQQKEYAKKGFAGRGPVQVTGEYNYVQSLAYLEKDAEMLRKSPNEDDRYLAARAQEAADAIKKDPKNAANPRYAFLFSAAFMQMAGGVRRSPQLQDRNPQFPGNSVEDSWVSGHHHKTELADATARLATAQKNLSAAEADPATSKAALDAAKASVKTESNSVQEWSSTVTQGVVKAATFQKAIEVLGRKDVTKKKPNP
jgi:predicted chitinase